MDILEKLKDLRENRFSKRLTIEQTAKLLELSHRQSYDKYEYGKSNVPIVVLEKICNLYKVSPNYFMTNCFGKTTCLLSRLKDFDKKKWNYVYEEFGSYDDILIEFNANYKPTDFFAIEIPNKLFEEHELSKSEYHTYYENIIKNIIATKEYKSSTRIVSIPFDEVLMEYECKNTLFLMKKENHAELISKDIDISSICMISTRRNKKIYLAIINKTKKDCEIIPFYDVVNKMFVLDYPYKSSNGYIKTFLPIEEIENPAKLPKPLSIDDIEIMAKCLIIYDSHDSLTFSGPMPF